MSREICIHPPTFEGVLRPGVSLGVMTSIGLGGEANLYAEPIDALDLRNLMLEFRGEPLTVIGNGTSLLVPEAGAEGLVISLRSTEFRRRIWQGVEVRVGAGAKLATLVEESVRRGLHGLEFAAGMPGTVGGAFLQNASARDHELLAVIERALWIDSDGDLRETKREDFESLKQFGVPPLDGVVVEVQFRLTASDPESTQSRYLDALRWRRANQPVGIPCIGPLFRAPKGVDLGALLQEYCSTAPINSRIGHSRVDRNFVVRRPDTRSDDIVQHIDAMRSEIWRRTGVRLDLRVNVLRGEEVL